MQRSLREAGRKREGGSRSSLPCLSTTEEKEERREIPLAIILYTISPISAVTKEKKRDSGTSEDVSFYSERKISRRSAPLTSRLPKSKGKGKEKRGFSGYMLFL